MENGLASAFTGLRVLVVDDDPTWLKILERMLIKCSYEVTTCCLARDALDILRERKDGFDIVISDVNMPDMDGFKLLEHVGLEMDLPVIMMSVDGETSRVMKGVQHGACDYLLKPVRMKELRNIWQHVLRKKIHEVKDIETYEGNERNGSGEFDDGNILSGCDLPSAKKRKDMENKEHDDQEFDDPSAVKKPRVVWSVDLHQKFVNAVNQIGFDKVGPKKILDLMNVPWLTRENVASHLQKYRLYLSRLQKQNEPKTSFCVVKQVDFTSKDPPPGSCGPQSSITIHQNNAADSNFGCSGNKMHVQNVGLNFLEGDLKSIISFLSATESKKVLTGDAPDPQMLSNGSPVGLSLSFESVGQDVNYAAIDSTIPPKHSWNREIPMMQFMQQPKQKYEPYLLLENGYVTLPLPGLEHHIQPNHLQPAPSVHPASSVTDFSEVKPLCAEFRSNHVKHGFPIGCTIDSFSFQAEIDIVNPQDLGAMSTITGPSSMINHSFVQNHVNNWESTLQNLVPVSGSDLVSLHDDIPLCSLKGYGFTENVGFNNIELLNFDDPAVITELPGYLYDGLMLNYEFLCDSI